MPDPIQQPIEKPAYILTQVKKRLLIPKIITFLVLGIVFYLGVLLNITLLNLSGSTETMAKLIALIVLLLIIAFGICTKRNLRDNIPNVICTSLSIFILLLIKIL